MTDAAIETWESAIRSDPRVSLIKKLHEHSQASCAFSNSVASAYGWGSRAGRVVDSFEFNNSYQTSQLHIELSDDFDAIPDDIVDDWQKETMTKAARDMVEQEHKRIGRRKLVPLQDASRETAIRYLDERHRLFSQAGELVRSSACRRQIRRNLKRVKRVRDILAGETP
jgi:hypothetical protein